MQILLIGDVMLGRLVNQVLKSESPAYVWGDTLPLFAAGDVRVCNLECVLSDRGRPWSVTPKVFHFRSDHKNVAVLRAAKIDVLSIANNHALDYEYDALLEMLSTLENAGIKFAGAGRSSADAWKPAVLASGNIHRATIAFTDNEPDWEATPERPGTCYVPVNLDDPRGRQLLEFVTDIKSQVDCLIVSCHWGPNWDYRPPNSHIVFGHALVDAGADVVYGHSAHVFRGIEVYRGRPILYSTGDFIDDYAVDEIERNDESFIFVLDFLDGAVREISLYPAIISEFRARRADPEEARRISTKMQRLCSQFRTPCAWSSVQNRLIVRVSEAAERSA
jgi:poly-gamma-glutamate capsule biosynthesis protein CapA/YwtB (metallophosphatase superfamily)